MAERCIYADDFLDLFYVASAGQDKMFVKVVEQVVEDTPTADVVEVVRCKNCKFWDDDERCNGIKNGLILEYTNGYDYCSYGERKESNDR